MTLTLAKLRSAIFFCNVETNHAGTRSGELRIFSQTMESHAQSVEDTLIQSLSFKLRPGASYITDRRSVTYFPVNGGSYGPNGVKVIKVMLNGSDSWLDPSTLKFFFNVSNFL